MRKEENAMEQNKPEIEQVPPELVHTKPDWTINELYKNAWQIVKKNKILWLFGMAVGAGSMSGNYSNSIDGKDMDALLRIFEKAPKETTDITKVLGSSTSVLSDAISSLFAGIPPAFYVLLGFEVLILIIFGMIISVIYSSWAHAALLEGIQAATGNGKLTIRDLSEKAFGCIKSVIYVQYIPYLLLGVASIGLFAVLLITTFLLPKELKTLTFLATPIVVGIFLIAILDIILITIWAMRIVVIDKKPAKQALKMGYKIAKKKFWASILLGFVNVISIGLLYVIILLPILGFIIWGSFTVSENTYLGTGIIVFGAVFLMVFILGASILGGITEAFKTTVWSLAYNAIRGKYEK